MLIPCRVHRLIYSSDLVSANTTCSAFPPSSGVLWFWRLLQLPMLLRKQSSGSFRATKPGLGDVRPLTF